MHKKNNNNLFIDVPKLSEIEKSSKQFPVKEFISID